MLAGVWAVLVRLKLAGVPTPLTVADTLKTPECVLAVKFSDIWPLLLVAALMVAALLLKDPLPPVLGALNVTVALGTGLLKASVTVTRSGFENEVPTVALWPEPEVA